MLEFYKSVQIAFYIKYMHRYVLFCGLLKRKSDKGSGDKL